MVIEAIVRGLLAPAGYEFRVVQLIPPRVGECFDVVHCGSGGVVWWCWVCGDCVTVRSGAASLVSRFSLADPGLFGRLQDSICGACADNTDGMVPLCKRANRLWLGLVVH